MAWECWRLVALFFFSAGVMGTGAESKSFSMQRANCVRKRKRQSSAGILPAVAMACGPRIGKREYPSNSRRVGGATIAALRTHAFKVGFDFFQSFPLGFG